MTTRSGQRGLGVIECLIIVSLVGIAAIGLSLYFNRGPDTVPARLAIGSTTLTRQAQSDSSPPYSSRRMAWRRILS